MGGAVAIDSGHCSSLAALSVSVDALLCGDVDMMICAAGQRRLGLPEYEGLAINGALCADGAPSSPLDQAAHGYVPAEGVGVVLLKRLADARRDGDPIVATIRGIGAAHHASAGEALRVSIERSLATADRAAADIGLMEVDGAMSVDEGADQLRALSQLHTVADRVRPLMLSSVAGQIGHAEAAAGMASLIKASLELDRGILPRPVDVRQPIASAGLTTPTTQTSVAEIASEGALAAVCSRSRGLTYHVLIESGKAVGKPARGKTSVKQSNVTNAKPSPASKPAATSPFAIPVSPSVVGSRVLTFAADSAEGLISELTAACGRAAELFAQGSERPFQLSDRFRAAIVADTPQSLAAKLELAVKQGLAPAGQAVLRQQGIYLGETPRECPRVVFCFPGQGSQYPGMLKLLVEQSPAARRALDEVEAILERYGYQSFSDLAWGDSAAMGKQVWPTQLAMLIANWVMFQTVQSVGIVPDAVLGHSFGEYSALAASGAIDIETAIALTRARCDGIAAARVQGGLLAAGGSAQRVAELVQQAGLAIHVANFNTPDQTVVGGAPEDLARFEAILKGAGIGAKLLAVPAPFHTPLMAPAGKPLERALAEAQFSNPRVPFWSVVTNRSVTTADEARDNLSRHNTSPVMYVDLIHAVSAGQPCVLVEVGPQQVLSGLHRRILDSTDQVAIACDQPKRPGLEQIEQVRAALMVMGVLDMEHSSPHPLPGGRGTRPPRREPLLAFDATTRRRERMRQTAQSGGARAARTAAPVSAPPKPVAQAAAPAPPPPRPAPAAPVAQNGHAPRPVTPPPAPVAKAPSNVDLERFLINFVVEQTGYPPEVVELDADLEADLGIDSIKKAQLFGELQEYFDVVPTEELTLDQFPTLRHVLEFLRTVPMKGAGLEEVAAAAPARPAAPTPAPVTNPAPAAAQAAPGVDELERFLINFVVEQTGYPPEVVELDADLEADLGIDSIKKAQLFGELQEYFDVVPTEELTLDQFPTLRHVLDFLRTVPIRATASLSLPESTAAPQAEPPPVTGPAPQPAAAANASAPNVDELERFLINFVVEQTGYPPEVVELDADLEADLGIDSIKKAQLFGELQEYFDVVPT
jgi:acyl transferase domain-containing protein